ncbi:MAG: hypothetical protein QM535_09560 [Limnohabitans sp.]|nr:hypothetical protein [Limnohabitans sp.]
MKKVFLLAGMLAVCTSCTYEDVVNYLTGKENNLTQEEKDKVNQESSSGSYIQELSRTEVDHDRGNGRPTP